MLELWCMTWFLPFPWYVRLFLPRHNCTQKTFRSCNFNFILILCLLKSAWWLFISSYDVCNCILIYSMHFLQNLNVYSCVKNWFCWDIYVIAPSYHYWFFFVSYQMPLLIFLLKQSCFGKNIVIDPTAEEEACQDGSLMIACMPARNEVTQLTLTGQWSTAKTNEVWIHLHTLRQFY